MLSNKGFPGARKMEKIRLVFVPAPAIGHVTSTVEVAKLLLDRHKDLSINVFIIKRPNFDSKIDDLIQTFVASTNFSTRIQFIDLPKDDPEISDFHSLIERQKSHVKQAVFKINEADQSTPDSPRLAGFVVDMFCTAFIDVANEFGVPSYIFFTSGAAFLGFMLHIQKIYDEENMTPTDMLESGAELAVPCLMNSFPAKVMPHALLTQIWWYRLIYNFRRFKETKGIMVNTFLELESYAVESFSEGKILLPPVYPIGPILNCESDEVNNKRLEIMQWLDNQPPESVVFLCFGSRGCFDLDQVKEIAYALEHSGYRFLWSLRRPTSQDKDNIPSDYEDFLEVLPIEFLDRTAEIGKIIGWAPQKAILSHPAIGGFVSHCGWNSVLESIWYGVPIATWPLYAEQQLNAFEMVIELKLGVEIKMDYKIESGIVIKSDEIERGIRCLMNKDGEEKKKVKKMSESSRKALMEGGSSYIWLDHFMKDVIDNIV